MRDPSPVVVRRLDVLLPLFVAVLVSPVVAQQPPALVVVAPVVEADVAASQSYVGTVEPSRRAVIGSAVDGRVSEFRLRAGERVEGEGDGAVLARVLTRTIELEREAAAAELELRAQELVEIEKPRLEDVQLAEAARASAEAALELARSERTRADEQFRNRIITSAVLEAARSAEQVAAETLKQRAAELELARTPRLERIKQAEARRDMHAALVAKLDDQIAKYTIRSRFPGYVVMEHTEVGNWLKRGDPVAEVVALDEVDVVVRVLEGHVPHVKVGMQVAVVIPALGSMFPGTVHRIVPQANPQSRTFPVEIRVENVIEEDVPRIKAGMLARVHLPTSGRATSLLVPKDAIVLGNRSDVVYVVSRKSRSEPLGSVTSVPVELGISSGESIVVRGELPPGAEVVVRGNERLRPGQPVSVIDVQETKLQKDVAVPMDESPAPPGETPPTR